MKLFEERTKEDSRTKLTEQELINEFTNNYSTQTYKANEDSRVNKNAKHLISSNFNELNENKDLLKIKGFKSVCDFYKNNSNGTLIHFNSGEIKNKYDEWNKDFDNDKIKKEFTDDFKLKKIWTKLTNTEYNQRFELNVNESFYENLENNAKNTYLVNNNIYTIKS